MDTKEQILKKARAYKKRNFLTEKFTRYYWDYCKHHDVSAREFIYLVFGENEDNIELPNCDYSKINPTGDIREFIKFYENVIIDKPYYYEVR